MSLNQLRILSRSILLLIFFGLISGCGNKKDEKIVVTIQATFPSGDIALVAGDSITFQVDVKVQGMRSTGRLGLIAQSADGTIVAECAPVAVPKDSTVRLTAVGVVPATTVVHLFTPLYIEGTDKTDLLDTRLFKVIGKRFKE